MKKIRVLTFNNVSIFLSFISLLCYVAVILSDGCLFYYKKKKRIILSFNVFTIKTGYKENR